jgi:hypothetical protein
MPKSEHNRRKGRLPPRVSGANISCPSIFERNASFRADAVEAVGLGGWVDGVVERARTHQKEEVCRMCLFVVNSGIVAHTTRLCIIRRRTSPGVIMLMKMSAGEVDFADGGR